MRPQGTEHLAQHLAACGAGAGAGGDHDGDGGDEDPWRLWLSPSRKPLHGSFSLVVGLFDL